MEHTFSRTATFTRPSNVTAYTALDVVGATAAALTFLSGGGPNSIFSVTGVEVQLDQATAAATVFRLHLYSVTPPSALADNAAFDIPTGDRASYLGYVDTSTAVDFGSTIYATSPVVNKGIRAPESASIFGYLQAITGFTPESAITGSVHIHCKGS